VYIQKPAIMSAQSKLNVSQHSMTLRPRNHHDSITSGARQVRQQNPSKKQIESKPIKTIVHTDPESFYDKDENTDKEGKYHGAIMSVSMLPQVIYSDNTTKNQKGLTLINTECCHDTGNMKVNNQLSKKIHPSKLNHDKFDIKFVNYKQLLVDMSNFIEKNGGFLVCHSWINDEDFFMKTDKFSGRQIFKDGTFYNFSDRFKDKTMKNNFKNIKIIDICSVIQNLSNKFMNILKEFEKNNNNKYYSKKLESYIRVMKGQKNYEQPHTSDGDVSIQSEFTSFIVKLEGHKVIPDIEYVRPYKIHNKTIQKKTVEQLFQAPLEQIRKPTIKHEFYSNTSTYLDVPYDDKDAAKALGARWNRDCKKWFVPAGVELNQFTNKWSKLS
jgi:hypothetical protein